MRTIDGPIKHAPIPVYIGEDFVLEIPLYDGLAVSADSPYGSRVSVSASTKKGILRVYKPDGTTSISRDTSVSGEGEKADGDGDGTNDSYRFLIAASATALWTNGANVAWEVEHQDSTTTPTVARLIAYGTLSIRSKPATSNLANP